MTIVVKAEDVRAQPEGQRSRPRWARRSKRPGDMCWVTSHQDGHLDYQRTEVRDRSKDGTGGRDVVIWACGGCWPREQQGVPA